MVSVDLVILKLEQLELTIRFSATQSHHRLQVLACCGLVAFKAMFTQQIVPSEKCVADLEENLLQSLVFLPQICSLMPWIWKPISPIEWLTTTIPISDVLFFRGVDLKKSVLYKLTQISATNA